MAQTASALTPQNGDPDRGDSHSTGILPDRSIREAIARGQLTAGNGIEENQIQPASLDLRLGTVAYRMQASFLPGPESTVAEKLQALSMHKIDLTGGAVLEKGCVYLVPLQESLALRKRLSAIANPKSSTGRLDIFARVITDYAREFDHIAEGYSGPLWAEISPRSFSVLVTTGARLVQLRLKAGSPRAGESALRRLQDEVALVDVAEADIKRGALAVSVDLGGGPGKLVGYRAKKHSALIDIGKINHYDPADFWEPVHALNGKGKGGAIILDPGDFYILASKEAVTVPPDHAAEMIAYDTLVGEFRVHYAGFFDPGFGHTEAGGAGSRAVLEVRSHEVPFMLEDGQIVGRLFYERLTAKPQALYGSGIGSNYQQQGLQLSKQFRRV